MASFSAQTRIVLSGTLALMCWENATISLILRKIGARRGRAARGRPDHVFCL